MVSRNEDKIDFGKLEEDVRSAVDADERYWRENDAKFRAVHQKVASYDEFREIVLAAHLKPLEKGDNLENMKFTQPWNSSATKVTEDEEVNTSPTNQKLEKFPVNGMEFGRDWRRVCKTDKDKYDFLLQIGGENLAKIFHSEISFGLLGEFLLALNNGCEKAHGMAILNILSSLPTTQRFPLAVQFLSGKEKDAAKSLYSKCQTLLDSDEAENNEGNKQKLQYIEKHYELDK